MSVSPARRIAFEVLRRVEAEGAYATDLLHARLSRRDEPVKREDAALATELTLGVLRWQRLLDFLLGRYLTRRGPKDTSRLDLEVRLALRLGLYQLRFLTRVPASAAVNDSVEQTKQARKGSAASLVNAVLRRASEAARAPVEPLLPRELPLPERLGILYSHPTWLVERWLKAFGEPRTVALLEANNRAPRLTCTVCDPAGQQEIVATLERAGLSVEPGKLLRTALAFRGGDPAETEAFRRGRISVQDEASQAVALLLSVEPGQSVLDLCAAPGGKTALLARAAGVCALVIAADRHPRRLRATREQLGRVGATQVHLLALDAMEPLPLGSAFDRILVDAPCSGTGTLARNPEIRWRLRSGDLADLHRRQTAFLANALDRLAPDGRLVYSTCSLEPEENEQVVAELLKKRSSIRRVSGAGALVPHLADGVSLAGLFDAAGDFRTFPPEHHTDGFFAAVLAKL